MSERGVDPWGDLSWSDGEAPPDTTADATRADAPVAEEAPGSGSEATGEPASCPWCATPATAEATRCSSCGAALAQREAIGDLVIPGLTTVDPALKDLDGRPIHLRGPSPTHGVASGLIGAAAAGGPAGLVLLGGVGAVAAAEYLGAGGDKGVPYDQVGETSGAVLQALERLERGEALPTATDTTPRPELDAATTASGAQSSGAGGASTTGRTNPGTVAGIRDEEAMDGGR